jgi:lipoyl(octanoyl) transferase
LNSSSRAERNAGEGSGRASESRPDQPTSPPPLETRWLGRIGFQEALAQQEEFVRQKHANPKLPDALWLLEHDPVYTIGRTSDRSSLRGASHLPHPLFLINRGGQATWHGPGQLVGYFLLDLRRHGQDLHRYLRWIEALLTELLESYEIMAKTRAGLTGVWIAQRKIASIGVGVRHWITMHGFALNVSGDLGGFDAITPCGIADVTMTSIEKETGQFFPLQSTAKKMAEIAENRLPDLSGSARSSRAGLIDSPKSTQE